jgi:hypothetical protein
MGEALPRPIKHKKGYKMITQTQSNNYLLDKLHVEVMRLGGYVLSGKANFPASPDYCDCPKCCYNKAIKDVIVLIDNLYKENTK